MGFFDLFKPKVAVVFDTMTTPTELSGGNVQVNPSPNVSLQRKKGRLQRIMLMIAQLEERDEKERIEFFRARKKVLELEIKIAEGEI